MDDQTNRPTLVVVKPTFLRLKLLYAAFVLVIFIASIFLALVMFDNGISFFKQNQSLVDWVIGSVFLLVGLMAVVGSLLILLPALRQLWLAIQLEQKGLMVEGTIVEKYLEKDKEGKRYGFVACVFNGNYLLEQNVVTTLYENMAEGDKVVVRCLQNNFNIARLEKSRE